jgi:glycine/D-amino acid oxidase-like deaminating enzyme
VPGYGTYYWGEQTPGNKRPTYAPFRGERTADAVVIGGGLTGATAAYLFAAAGLDVVLLEAGRLAGGATAGSLGAIVPQPDAFFRDVESTCGRRAARAVWQTSRKSALELASLLRRLKIRCDLAPRPFVLAASTSERLDELGRERAFRKAAGVDAPWLTGRAATAALGTDALGAIRLRECAALDPVRAALGLATAAHARGAAVHEKSLVKRTRFTRKYADVILAGGSIRTTHVFVATGGPGDLFGQLRRHVREQEGFAVVTEPLTAPMRSEIGPRSAIVTDAEPNAHWLRWLAGDRALFAGALSAPSAARQREKAIVSHGGELMYQLSVRYPIISGLPARWAWSVPVISTADRLPWIGAHRNYPFHFFAMAFGWHGDGLAWHSAKAALRQIAGTTTREDEAFGFLR